MRIVLDTNILLSALLVHGTPPGLLFEARRDGRFELVTCEDQIGEIARVTRRPAIRSLVPRSIAGRLVNQIRRLATMYDDLPSVSASPDAGDDYLLALALKAEADYVVTGDKSGLLSLRQFGRTRIVTARAAVSALRLRPP